MPDARRKPDRRSQVIQLTVLDAVCDWCLASDAISGGIAVLAVLRLRGSPAPEEQILAGTA